MFDATHDNILHLPSGQSAGYSTGLGGGMWTPADWQSHPGAVRLSQRIALQDEDLTADVIGFEVRAATDAGLVAWGHDARIRLYGGTPPGQPAATVYPRIDHIRHV